MTESRARHQPATAHHEAPAAGAYVTELKLPAVGDYIVVAKRAAASLGLAVEAAIIIRVALDSRRIECTGELGKRSGGRAAKA